MKFKHLQVEYDEEEQEAEDCFEFSPSVVFMSCL